MAPLSLERILPIQTVNQQDDSPPVDRMHKFAMLTQRDTKKQLFVNPNQVLYFYSDDLDGTMIWLGAHDVLIQVEESPGQVQEVLQEIETPKGAMLHKYTVGDSAKPIK